MVTAQSILLSIALQSSSEDYLLLFLFLVVAIIFFAIFFYWWLGVSGEDLDDIKVADANQIAGPATFGEVVSVHKEVEVQVEEEEVIEETEDVETIESEPEVVEAETAVSEPVDEIVVESSPADESVAPEPEPTPTKPDDLKKIEGVGSKIEELLHNAGIQTYSQLAGADVEQLKQILADAGSRYRLADPTSWPAQAKLAASSDWDGLNEFQDKLTAGRHAD